MFSLKETAGLLGLKRAGSAYTGACQCCGYPSGFSLQEKSGKLLAYCNAGQCTQTEIWRMVREKGAGNPDYHGGAAKVAKPAKDHQQASDWAVSLWLKSQTAKDSLVESYLKSRGISIAIPNAIRFLPSAQYAEGQVFPAMISTVTDWRGEIKAIHRTFLAWDGSGKANVPEPKKSLGPIKGAGVHLAKPASQIIITEGIETGLSVMQATGLSTWAALSTGGMTALILPPLPLGSDILIAADSDLPGERAAYAAAERWHREGRRVTIASPREMGCDFNDLLKKGAF
jgi:putative DNA primase/helicase